MLKWLFRRDEKPDQYGADRSPQWRGVRNRHVAEHPLCMACGASDDIEVHHIVPFHEHPELELEPDNLMTFCGDCHFKIGHRGRWSRVVPTAPYDAIVASTTKCTERRS